MIWLLLILFIAWAIWSGITKKDEEFGLIAGPILSVAAAIILSMVTISNGSNVAQWQAFYDYNTVNYEVAVDKTASYLSSEQKLQDVLVEGSIEKLQQASYVSERIAEWRDAVNRYNTEIARAKYLDGNCIVGILYPNKVQDMKMLVIK